MRIEAVDVVVIGSGMGGACAAAGLAGSGASVRVLERGERLVDCPEARDARAVFREGRFRPRERWRDGEGRAFDPGNYYNVGGNTKFYGAVLTRFRAEDFAPRRHPGGETIGWPFSYRTLAPWYDEAERLFAVRGALGEDPTEPAHAGPYPHPPVPDEPAIAAVRARLAGLGLRPFSLPLGIDLDAWLARGRTPWDAYPDTGCGKMDAESRALAHALADPNVRLETGAKVRRLEADPDGEKIATAVYERHGEERRIAAKVVVLAAGAVNSAALLLASGLANGSDQVGRNFMNHNATAMIGVDPRRRNDAVYQKTLGVNDYYHDDGEGGGPLGNVQLLGKVTGPILAGRVRAVPEAVLGAVARRSIDWYLMSEDLPRPDSRVTLDGDTIVLDWRRSNVVAHERLVARWRRVLKKAGYPIVVSETFDRRTPSHQCGTARMGIDPARSVVDPFGRAHDHPNLFVVDASVLPTSAAVNPALTIGAIALRAAHHIRETERTA